MGIKFPKEVSQSAFFDDLKQMSESQYVRRPVVIFPEATKTNGRGVLNIEDDLVDIIVKAAKDGLKIHTIRFDYEFKYHSPYNSTDPLGLKSMFGLMVQFTNIMTF